MWRVGDLIIDVGRQRVSRGDRTIELPKLSFDLLLALVRASPNVLSTEALLEQVWPGLVVNPETVVQRVKLLRDALDDRAGEPGYVVALRGRGYRLASDAVRIDDHETPAQRSETTGLARPTRRATLLAVAAVLLIAAAAAWFLSRDRAPTETPADGASADARSHTVAVLPFKNLGADSADTFMSVAVPDVILSRLASSPELTVVARDSAFRVDAESRDPAEVGRRLGASFLVEGTVQKSGDALRVTARLIDADTQRQLWSARFDRPVADLFAMQNEIAEHVATALGQRVTHMHPLGAATAPTANSAAYLAYLRGRTLIDRYTAVQAEAAAAEFERAIALDRDFAAAYVGLYDARMQAAAIKFDDVDRARRHNRPLLEQAIALDPQSAAVLFARAMWDDLDDEPRESLFREAMRRDPGNSRGLIAFVDFLEVISGWTPAEYVRGSGVYATRFDFEWERNNARDVEIGQLLARAIEIDPLSAPARYRQLSRETMTREQEETKMEGLLALDPNYYPALQRVAWVRWLFRDSPSQAIALIERAIAVDPENPTARVHAVAFYLDINDPAAAADVAAATRASAMSATPTLAVAAGDWRRASAAARQPSNYAVESFPSLGPSYALRDAALRTGDYADAERMLCEEFGMALQGPVEVTLWNFRAWVLLAHLQLAQGRKADAQRILDAVIAWIDADRIFGPVYNQRTHAQALMLLGRRDDALRALGTSFQVDRDHVDWWYTLEHDPVFDEVRDTPEFQALAPDVRRFVARERAAVDGLRQRGEIPKRPGPGRTGAGGGP
jgi:TolB-like protein/DNA-binding winged helix-turn-helix (wHTH) protein/tetratricopeptide (TPR) repeat protein